MKDLTKVLIGCVLGGVLAVSVALNLWQRQTVSQERNAQETLKNTLCELSIENDSIIAANDSLSLLLASKQYLIDSLDVLVLGNQRQIRYLNRELNKAMDEINDMPYEEVVIAIEDMYDFDISSTAINVSGTKDIYKDAIKVNYLDSIRVEQKRIIIRQQKQMMFKDDMILTLRNDNDAKTKLIQSLYLNVANLTEQNALTKEELRQVKRALRLWKAGTITAGAAIVALLIIL